MWMTSAGQTTSQMPQPVHFPISMLSIIPLHSKNEHVRPRVSGDSGLHVQRLIERAEAYQAAD